MLLAASGNCTRLWAGRSAQGLNFIVIERVDADDSECQNHSDRDFCALRHDGLAIEILSHRYL